MITDVTCYYHYSAAVFALIKNEITPIQNTESEPLISKVNTKYRI